MSDIKDLLFSYTNRSYEASRQEGIRKIPVYSNGTWTDTNMSDPGIIILDYVHALVDMVQYYQDHNALESYLSTAKERKNIFRLAKQLGYQIASSKGATVDATISVRSHYSSSFKIPKNTMLSSTGESPITYLTVEDAYIYAGETSTTVPCVQGSLGSITYTGTGTSSLDNTYTPRDQYVEISVQGVDIDSISVYDNSRNSWSPVEYLAFVDSNKKVYEPVLNHDGTVTLKFGDGKRGYSPSITDELYISYIYNKGSKGKIGVGELTNITILEPIVTLDGQTVSGLQVTNEVPSTGGLDPEDSESIRRNSPGVLKAQDRAVTLGDYEALAKRIPGVRDAIAYDIKNAPEMCLHYEVKVLIIPSEGDVTEKLRKDVYDYLYARCIPPTVLTILSPVYEYADITSSIVIENTYIEEEVDYNVRVVLDEYFRELSSTVGARVDTNILISLISRVKGVRYVESLSSSFEGDLDTTSVARLGEVTLSIKRGNS